MPRIHFDHLNSQITSYIKNGEPSAALNLYIHARTAGACLDIFTVPSVLKACAQLSALRHGMEIHSFILKSGLHQDVFVHNSLIQLYSECGTLASANKMFDEMPERDVVSWSTMIRGYARSRLYTGAVSLVREMLWLGVRPTEVAMTNMLNLFADVADLRMGWPMHAYLLKNGCHQSPGVNAITSLIDMYVKCRRADYARRVFDLVVEKSTASWSAMIAGHVRSGNMEAGVKLFAKMVQMNVVPSEITMLSLVLECGFTGESGLARWIHAYILRNGFEISTGLGTALVDMYCKCGKIVIARMMFERMKERSIMSWNAMISGYARSGSLSQAFQFFSQMKGAGVKANEMTMVSLLSLCSEEGALDRGRCVHACSGKQGIESDVVLATALIDMYVKCGDVDRAYMVFSRAMDRDVCMWNAMVNGLAMNSHGGEAIKLFYQMEREGIEPNDVSFIGILRACSHAGLVEEGMRFFNQMGSDFGLVPKVEHYGCMVDLLGRGGKLHEALEVINGMPVVPNVVVWGALLAACKVYKNPKLGALAAEELLKLDPNNSSYNVLLSDIYASGSRWDDVADVRRSMKAIGIKKAPGITSMK